MPDDSEVDLDIRPWPPAFSGAFVDDARATLTAARVLVAVGPPGGARDELAAAVAGLVRRPSPTRHVARQGEDVLPYFALGQLFTDLRPSAGAGADVVAELVRDTIDESDEPPLLVLVDAELADPESVDVLVDLAGSGHLLLVATIAPGAEAARDRLLATGGAVVEVPPLDGPQIADLLRTRFGAEPHPSLTEQVLQRTGGAHGFVHRLVDACVVAGTIVVDDGMLVVGPPLPGSPAGGPGATLVPPADGPDSTPTDGGVSLADLVDVTALLGQLDADEARTLFGARVVEIASTAGVLSLADDTIGFTFPVEAPRTMDLDRQGELFDRYADALPRTTARAGVAPRAADWWRATGHLLPVDLAARAARGANLQGRYRRALVYSDPGNNVEHAPIVPVERGFAFIELGRTDEFLALYDGIEPAHLGEDELFSYLLGVALLDDDERDRLTQRALHSDDPATRRRREAVRTLSDLARATFVTAGEKVASRLRALAFSGQLSPGNRAMAFATLSAAMRHSARPAQALQASTFALEILSDAGDAMSAHHLATTHELHVRALMTALDLPGAEDAVRAYSAAGLRTGGSGRLETVLLALVRMQHGEVRDALDNALKFLDELGTHDPHMLRGWIEAVAAECLVHLDRASEAMSMLDTAARHPSALPQVDLERRITMAAVRDALAEPEEALEILDGVIDETIDRGLRLTRIEAAAAGVLVGGPPQVERLIEAVDDLVDPTGVPKVWQSFAWAVREYDIASIVDLADDLEAKEARLMAAGVAQFVLDMARRATDLTPETRTRLSALADLSAPRLP
ncbi:hypothetical protein [Aeromicrobium fastidiosum]|uniref:Uncharacterized protein n=1 Tax=Aeromicrobium fastidiosum TaxID=52699 RepID=A0A641AS96_9ACTN|nr:hypothetical protein [Aeromicrobium fastidiosum]KAA1380829.1 hypothetical protein ESP62_006625 [Aeromicrobium fastidiosum]MBP2390455.1 hypothetical protein [Aeromicrobium fastidiosum]